ncbi:hypothetical protein ABK040_010869 [Willaertia magna]
MLKRFVYSLPSKKVFGPQSCKNLTKITCFQFYRTSHLLCNSQDSFSPQKKTFKLKGKSDTVGTKELNDIEITDFELKEAKKEVIEIIFRLFSARSRDTESARLYLKTWINEIYPRERKEKTEVEHFLDFLLFGYYGQSCKRIPSEMNESMESLVASIDTFDKLFLYEEGFDKNFNKEDEEKYENECFNYSTKLFEKNVFEEMIHKRNPLKTNLVKNIIEFIKNNVKELEEYLPNNNNNLNNVNDEMANQNRKKMLEIYDFSNINTSIDIAGLVYRILSCYYFDCYLFGSARTQDFQNLNDKFAYSSFLRAFTLSEADNRCLLIIAQMNEAIIGNNSTASNERNKAELAYQLLVDNNPNDPDVLNNAGGFYLNRKQNPEKAKQYLLRALEINPNHSVALANYAQIVGAEDLIGDKAIDLFERSISIVPNDYSTLSKYASYLLSRGLLGFENESLRTVKKARDLFKRSLQIFPFQSASILSNYAHAEYVSGNIIDSKRAFEEAIKVYESEKETSTDPLLQYADFLCGTYASDNASQLEKAKSFIEKALKIGFQVSQQELVAMDIMATIYAKLGDLKKAEKVYKDLLVKYPNDERDILRKYCNFTIEYLKDGKKLRKLAKKLASVIEKQYEKGEIDKELKDLFFNPSFYGAYLKKADELENITTSGNGEEIMKKARKPRTTTTTSTDSSSNNTEEEKKEPKKRGRPPKKVESVSKIV